ncbi:MAG TPA: acyl-CoA dehydrogenase family protein, partial [Rugosimonospora sp.]|nr:acyl-CoA dehydrogenase family protein [Rugosimonospora sp.]
MGTAVTEEQRAIQDSIREWAAGADPLATVRGLEPGGRPDRAAPPWLRHWADLAGLGLFGIGVPEDLGG